MKKYINKLFVICTLLFLGVSCENDAILTSLKEVNFSGPIEASSNTIVISTENENLSVLTLSWPAVTFPVNAPVTYALEFDIPADAVGATAWSKAVRVEVGVDVLSKAFSGSDLNKMAIKLGLPVDVAGKIVVRVESTLDRKIHSNPIELNVTPFAKKVVFGAIYMPGSYQGWNEKTAAELKAIDSGIYQGYVTFPETQGLGFKFMNERSWSQFYGADANGNIVNGSDTDFQIAKAGSYQMTVNLNTAKWSSIPYAWGIVGDGTHAPTSDDANYGWNHSVPMNYDHVNKVWKITANLLPGNVKFRLNNAWTINYGPKNNNEGKAYLDDSGAHYISEAGIYEITFSIQEKDATTGLYPATATYKITKI
ncbi:SusE domain-containing protein [Flavobacterium sp. GB2R13]|uniref:SusE domain-containing protein n=1 Tax=Flavobacterium algoris TaxID=3398733 RepID=UPI003A836C66